MKPILIAILFIFLVLPIAVAQEQIVRQNTNVDISHPVRIGGATSTSLLVNISIRDPYMNPLVNFSAMTNNAFTQEHNFTLFNNTEHLGLYDYCITATDGNTNSTECFQFEVTLIGEKATTSQSVVFAFIGTLSIILFLLSLLGAIKIPFRNKRDARGFVVSLNDLKYVKIILWFVSYLLMIFILFAFRHVAQISNWDVASGFLNFAFYAILGFLFPTFVLLFVIGFANFFNDKRLSQAMSFNIKVK